MSDEWDLDEVYVAELVSGQVTGPDGKPRPMRRWGANGAPVYPEWIEAIRRLTEVHGLSDREIAARLSRREQVITASAVQYIRQKCGIASAPDERNWWADPLPSLVPAVTR